MKSIKADRYLRRYMKLQMCSDRLTASFRDLIPGYVAREAAELAEEELEEAHRAELAGYIQRLRAIRAQLVRGEMEKSRIMVNNLIIEMKK